MLKGPPRVARRFLALLVCAWLFFFLVKSPSHNWSWQRTTPGAGPAVGPEAHRWSPGRVGFPRRPEVELVVASMKSENTAWVNKYLSHWSRKIYVVDDPKAKFTVKENVGREAMVYLTYLVDNYDSLPQIILFHHAERFQWHNDNLDYDALVNLQRINLTYVRSEGYVNLRCVWVLGCPNEINPYIDQNSGDKRTTSHVYKDSFEKLLPGVKVPKEVGVTCCSQFAVTAETVRRRPRSDYEHFQTWLAETTLTSDLSGRVMEYSWHIIFGKEAIHCPRAQDCYCKLYGLCDLTCKSAGDCDGRYILPAVATLPDGWPMKGWQGENRNFAGPPVP